MVRPKASGSKKPKRTNGVDFKKIKRKIGRKLPPPKNATNTQIKSKAIVLPEQSMVSERTGMAVNSRGLTLKELLQQTSHHNAKTRKVALTGTRDLLIKHPSELKLHKVAVIEKLRERICDSDKAVREVLYNVLKTVIFPHIKEEITAPVISLMMAYVFNAMTHLAIDIRVMGFKFFHLIVLSHPSSFLLYAEKVLDCYSDIMRNKQLYLEDKSKIKDVLDGLLHCLSSFAFSEKKFDSQNEENATWRPLHAFGVEMPDEHTGLSSIRNKLEALLSLLIHCFQEFIATVHATSMIDALSFTCMSSILQIINLLVKVSFSQRDQQARSFGLSIPPIIKDHHAGNHSAHISLKKLWEVFPISSVHQSLEKGDNRYFILNIMLAQIFFHLPKIMDDTTFLKEKFLEFIERPLCCQVSGNAESGGVIQEKYIISLIEFIPGLVSQMMGYWKARLLQAFTGVFENCRVDSKLMFACLSALMQMLLPRHVQSVQSSSFNSEEMLCYQVVWLRKLPEVLLQLGDKHPSVSKVILEILLRVGQSSMRDSPLALEYDNLQFTLRDYYSTNDDQGVKQYGPFVKLPKDCQDIAICGIYYFSSLNLPLLESLAFCCLCDDLEPTVRIRILEVLHSAYKSGHVKLADHIGFLVTIVARFKVSPEFHLDGENRGKISNRETFRLISEAVFSCLSEMGDHSLVLRLLQKITLEVMSMKPHLDNMQSMLRMIILLDSTLSTFVEEAISTLGQNIATYLIDASCYMPDKINATGDDEVFLVYQFYARPCIVLFLRSGRLLHEVLKSLASPNYNFEPNKIHAVASTILFILKNEKLRRNLSSSEGAIKNILHNISILLSENRNTMVFEKRCSLQNVFHQLQNEASMIQRLVERGQRA
ncbi:unnamed protein product [Spirodela intermedia]|uniref:Uncharacterized protein n=1 Tax=Spirodela intermedia TaxID=51605 RepID=A0A7I8KFG5_SPIIN|nr:unnamed protein product [Spirodela intermedia]